MVGGVEHMTAKETEGILYGAYPTTCWLCDQADRRIYWGLATLNIEYPGPTRFICDVCVDKVKKL